MGLLQLLFKKKSTNSSAIDKHLSQSGNVFMMLFGAVGMVGVIGASTMTVMKGPVKTMSEVTKRTVAENNMIAAGKLALVSAASNDCDSDGVAEPFPFVTQAGSISGGGGMPANIGVAKQDPWGTDYAYCTWDHGDALAADPADNDGNCGASTNYRAGADGGTEYVLAIISAGPDRMFNTSCADVPASPVLNKTSGSDDLILGYTLAEAGTIAGGLWTPDGTTGAETTRNLSVTDGTNDTFTLDAATGSIAALGTGATGTFPIVRSDNLQSYTGAGGTITVDSALSSTSAITTTAALTGGATNVDSLDAGSGAITTTGTLNAGTSTLGATDVSSLDAGSGAITTTGTLNAGTSTLGGTTANSLMVTNGATVGGTFDVNGNVTLGDNPADTFDVTGISTLTGPLTVTGLSTMADIDATTLDATGAVTVGSLDAGSGAITTTGTLNAGVTTLGATTLSGELAMGANAITGLANPTQTDTDHAATVQYVNDRVASGTGFSEQDPEVGMLTANQWCVADGTGSQINCTAAAPTSSTDTLDGLSCGMGQIAKWNGVSWACAADNTGGGGGSGGSCDMGTWTSQTQFATTNNWNAIAYGNNMFVAVRDSAGNSGSVMTSPDGIAWTPQTSTNNNVDEIIYANGLFVTIGNGDVTTSPDGVTWTNQVGGDGRSIAYGNGIFVAVNNNAVRTSTDGVTWTAQTPASTDNWWSVTFGNNLFVAVATNGAGLNDVMTSPDGVTWTLRSAPVNRQWRGITYADGQFVAVSNDGVLNDNIMTSIDGINWTAGSTGSNRAMTGISHGNGRFVAWGTGANDLFHSEDAITWNQVTPPESQLRDIAHGNGKFVALTEDGFVLTADCGFSSGSADNLGDHTATQDLDLDSNKVINVADPTDPQDAATKAYVDANGGGADDLGSHVAAQNLDMNSFKIDNAESVIYEGVAGGTPIGGKGGIQSGIDTVAVSGDACNAVGALARTAGGELLVCEDTDPITDQSCSRFTPGALSISSTGQLHVCMN